MKVLFVTSELYPWKTGGVQNVVYNLAARLGEEIDLEMICIHLGDGEEGLDGYGDGVTFRFIEDRGAGPLKYLYRNLAYIRADGGLEDFDIVHFHILPGANCAFLPRHIKRRSEARLLLSVYDWIPDELEFYDTGEKVRHLMHWAAAKRGLKNFDGYIVNSSYVKDIVESYGLTGVTIMPNGIDMDEWRTSRRLALRGSTNILFWGRLFPKKGVDHLIKAFAVVTRRYRDIHLYIGGEGPHECHYRKLCRRLGLENRTTFLGGLSKDDLKAYLNSCDFCVFPSIYEGFGIAVLEAMAASRPVIVSERGGQVDFARHAFNALLVDLDKPDQLPHAIQSLATDERLRRELGENAARTATEYNWRDIAGRYVELYESMLSKGGI
ncbi:MAG: glycosyltransferase family 4 protein [Actinomycetota bacterium]|nr:glycosyltransferase family 4 protein [Actinomycetota bacterium]